MGKIRLLLLDDNSLMPGALTAFLEANSASQVVAHCSTTSDALDVLARREVDVVVFDEGFAVTEGWWFFIQRARGGGYTGRILLLTSGISPADCIRALAESVCGIFCKKNPADLLLVALQRVMNGQLWIDRQCILTACDSAAGPSFEQRKVTFAPRETEVIKGVLGGLSNRQIGVRLKISEASVKSTLQRLFTKTGVRTRSQLVRIALQEFGYRFDSPGGETLMN